MNPQNSIYNELEERNYKQLAIQQHNLVLSLRDELAKKLINIQWSTCVTTNHIKSFLEDNTDSKSVFELVWDNSFIEWLVEVSGKEDDINHLIIKILINR